MLAARRDFATLGLQADWNWTNAKADNFYSVEPGIPRDSSTLSYSSRENWFGTLRTRSGIVVDNLLLYVIGGLAWANFDRNLTYTVVNPPNAQAFSSSNTRLGFVVGFGTEWAFSQNWSITSEVLYMGFKKDQQSFSCSIGVCEVAETRVPYRYEFTDSQWVTRIGVNYRFNGYY
jgi:outer membrane immunogenic protein